MRPFKQATRRPLSASWQLPRYLLPINLLLASLGGGLALIASVSVSALTSDKNQPIYIESDSAELNEKKGITVYSGKVKMDQGSLRIIADKITIHSINNKVSKIIATGEPAHYQQKPTPDKNLVVAQGNTIKYEINPERLELLTNASIEQEGTTMTGDRIDYDITKALVKAGGNPESTVQRIQMVIPASSKENPTNLTPETKSDTVTVP